MPSSAGRRSSAASVTAEPRSRCSTAEISRSMYIAASTIAIAPMTPYSQPVLEDAGEDEELAGERAGARHRQGDDPRGHQHGREHGSAFGHAAQEGEVVRRRAALTLAASRNRAAEMSPWLTICSTAPSKPSEFPAKSPSVISPICARLE